MGVELSLCDGTKCGKSVFLFLDQIHAEIVIKHTNAIPVDRPRSTNEFPEL